MDFLRQKIWKTAQQWPQDWQRLVFIPVPKKGNDKDCSAYHTIALISHVSKVMLKILQAWLQQYVNHKLLDVQAGFRKGRGTRNQIASICWVIEKAREFQKKIYFFASLTMLKPYQTSLPASWEICMQVKKQQLETDMEKWIGSKRSTSKLCIVTLLIYLTYMKSISCEMLGWVRHKLESRLPGEISITSDM